MSSLYSPSPALRSFVWKQGFAIGNLQINNLIDNFMLQMELGKKHQSSLAMLPSFLHVPEKLDNNQQVIVIDAGGSNLRCAIASLELSKNSYKLSLKNERFLAMPGATKALTKTEFFKELYLSIEELLPFSNTIGLCFSYPCEISKELDGKLIRWTKEVEAEGVEGLWIAKELNAEIVKHHGEEKKIVLLNDTVACLLAGMLNTNASNKTQHHMGFILGTGTNCAYSDNKEIINIESGAFNGIPVSQADNILDSQCHDQGHYLFEKKISGRYLGNLCLTLLKLAADEKLFSNETCEHIQSFSKHSNNQLATESLNDLLDNKFSPLQTSAEDYLNMCFLIESVIERGALFSAIQLAAISRYQLKNEENNEVDKSCTICVEGSTFYQLRNYQEKIRHYLNKINQDYTIQYEFVRVEFASLAGAALAALQIR